MSASMPFKAQLVASVKIAKPSEIRLVSDQQSDALDSGLMAHAEFSKLRIDDLRAAFLVDGILRSRTSDLNEKLEKGINFSLSELGSLPRVSWLSNGFQFEDILFSRGDFYLVARRFDWPAESEIALKP
jgi:hypothetical protein